MQKCKLLSIYITVRVVIKDLTAEAKAKAKDLIAEARAKAKDLAAEAKAKAKDLIPRPRPRPRHDDVVLLERDHATRWCYQL